jgi:hypothetical protein
MPLSFDFTLLLCESIYHNTNLFCSSFNDKSLITMTRDLPDGSTTTSTNASDIQILEERSSATFIQKVGPQPAPAISRGAPPPPPAPETVRSRGAPVAQNPPSVAVHVATPQGQRAKGVKPPRPGY